VRAISVCFDIFCGVLSDVVCVCDETGFLRRGVNVRIYLTLFRTFCRMIVNIDMEYCDPFEVNICVDEFLVMLYPELVGG